MTGTFSGMKKCAMEHANMQICKTYNKTHHHPSRMLFVNARRHLLMNICFLLDKQMLSTYLQLQFDLQKWLDWFDWPQCKYYNS